MCEVLKELYKGVFDEDFVFDLDHRIKMQKVVYIMENLGIHVGEYSFSWDQYGPYSLALDDDAFRCSKTPAVEDVKFSEYAKNGMNYIRSLIKGKVGYDEKVWLECIASLHYLKYIMKSGTNNEEVISELEKRKHETMRDKEANRKAMEHADEIDGFLWGNVALAS